MNRFVFSNFMVGELLDNILAATTELRISPSVAAKLQLFNPGDGLEARLTLWDGQEDPEIVGCVGNAQTGVLIVTRAQEETTARAWPAGTQVRCVLSAAVINQALLASVDTQSLLQANFLALTGGTVTGPILLPPAAPTQNEEAANKAYVDSVQGNKLPLAGGTMLGSINMNGNRLLAIPAAVSSQEPVRKAEYDLDAAATLALLNDRAGSLTSAGTATAYTVTSNATYASLADGTTIRARLHTGNDDGATLQLNSFAAKAIHRIPGTLINPLVLRPYVPYDFVYSSSYDAWIVSGAVAEWNTGDFKLSANTTADPGFLVMNDSTIGNTGSGATYASANARALYLKFYGLFSDSLAPVAGGRGANALADWTANKAMTLTKTLGRVIGIAGAGSGLTSRTNGDWTGTETTTLSVSQIPTGVHSFSWSDPGHSHSINPSLGVPNTQTAGTIPYGGGSNAGPNTLTIGNATTGISISFVDNAGNQAHTNMQPTFWMKLHVHL